MSELAEVVAAIGRLRPRRVDAAVSGGMSGVVYPAAGASIEINPQASSLASSCNYAIPMHAAAAVPAIVDAILESS